MQLRIFRYDPNGSFRIHWATCTGCDAEIHHTSNLETELGDGAETFASKAAVFAHIWAGTIASRQNEAAHEPNPIKAGKLASTYDLWSLTRFMPCCIDLLPETTLTAALS